MADITMPQLGETVTEGTITRWLKQVGDEVAIDELLFEVSTDKVDSEVPSPAAGVLSQILVEEGETVPVGAALCVIGEAVGEASPAAPPAPAEEAAASREQAPEAPAPAARAEPEAKKEPEPAPAPPPQPAPSEAPVPAA